jgi:hypothetical protein
VGHLYLREAQFRPNDTPPINEQIEIHDEINEAITAVLIEQSFFLSEI